MSRPRNEPRGRFTVGRVIGTDMPETDWYETRWGRFFYWGVIGATLVAVGLSITGTEVEIPAAVYLFGFLGASVYAMTSFAKQFDATGRYRLKILSRTVAVLPLATGVYLLAFAFSGGSGQLNALNATASNGQFTQSDRVVAGLIFLAGIYVSATLRALGGLAERLLGLSARQDQADEEGEPAPDEDDSKPSP